MKQKTEFWLDEGEGDEYPFADADSLKALIAQLPSEDSQAVLGRIGEWLREIGRIPGLTLAQQFELLDMLDRLAQMHQLNLVPAYLDTPRMRKLVESQLWGASFDSWQHIANAYLACLERFQATQDASAELRQILTLIVCRALRALGQQLKWTLLRYGRVEEQVWRDLGRAYLLAGNWNFATRRVALYPGRQNESSAQAELLKALMLYMSAPESLSPVQQHITERLIAYLGGCFALHATPGPGCNHAFDLSMHLPPIRGGRRVLSPAPLLRFFGPGTATSGLHELRDLLDARRGLPAAIGLAHEFEPREIRQVIEHLLRCWSDNPPARRSARRELMTRLTVVPGFAPAVRWLQRLYGLADDDGAAQQVAESWVATDVSDGGYGARLPVRPGDWLRVDALVALRSEGERVCRMAIVRRIGADIDGEHQIGLRLIGEQALPVALFAAGTPVATDRSRAGVPAVLLNRTPDSHGRVQLLLKPGSFTNTRHIQMRLRDKLHQLEAQETIEQGEDYSWMAFRLVIAD